MLKVKTLILVFRDLEMKPGSIPKMRGYLASRYPKITELHNHLSDNRFDYHYPAIQYRVINNCGALIAINKGLKALQEIIFKTDSVIIGNEVIQIRDKEISIRECDLGVVDNYIAYQFSSPWMALKEQNYEKYMQMTAIDKQQFLRLILRENLKTISKGFSYTIPNIEEIKVDGFFKPMTVKFKAQTMCCFKGDFLMNFAIPEFFALGKQVARGFGVVKRAER